MNIRNSILLFICLGFFVEGLNNTSSSYIELFYKQKIVLDDFFSNDYNILPIIICLFYINQLI